MVAYSGAKHEFRNLPAQLTEQVLGGEAGRRSQQGGAHQRRGQGARDSTPAPILYSGVARAEHTSSITRQCDQVGWGGCVANGCKEWEEEANPRGRFRCL
jgi:hypothetical protein